MEENSWELSPTEDGSPTLISSRFQAAYHSVRGARTESLHVFLQAGFFRAREAGKEPIRIFELGLGTYLNAALTRVASEEFRVPVWYTGIEAFPPSDEILFRYRQHLPDLAPSLRECAEAPWGSQLPLGTYFQLEKIRGHWPEAIPPEPEFDVLYWDAFAPSCQPELWELPSLQRAFAILNPGGVLVTYCSKGEVRRNLKALGFEVEKLPGPPGKREMIRAVKPLAGNPG